MNEVRWVLIGSYTDSRFVYFLPLMEVIRLNLNLFDKRWGR
jgi:hypothetical protein